MVFVTEGLLTYRIFCRKPWLVRALSCKRELNLHAVSNKNRALAYCLASLTVPSLVLPIAYGALAVQYKWIVQINGIKTKSVFRAATAYISGSEAVLSGTLTHLLCKRRSGLSSTESLVKRIMRLTVATGTVVVFLGIAMLVAEAAAPNSFLWVALEFNVGRRKSSSTIECHEANPSLVYVICMFAMCVLLPDLILK